MPKNLPIGIDSFRKLVDKTKGYLFVDKTLMIKSFIEDGSDVSLICRPRRWGKSLTFSMIQHFFAAQVDGQPTSELFDGLQIAQVDDGKYMTEQGKYPVIFITLKEVKEASFEDVLSHIKRLISSLYEKYRKDLLASEKISDHEKLEVTRFIEMNVSKIDLQDSLQFLSHCLQKHTEQQVYILIDEYDAPVMAAYNQNPDLSKGSYVDLITLFMRNFLSASLKGNNALKKGAITGVLRISHNEMLSGLNNPKIRTVLDDLVYSGFYGFMEDEVKELFTQKGLTLELEKAREMYNGYEVNGMTLYNPWSVNNCLDDGGKFLPYWVNTGDDSLIKKTLLNASPEINAKFLSLVKGETIEGRISPYTKFGDLETDEEALWTLLVYAGYLKPVSNILEDPYKYSLKVPNQEVFYVYRNIFMNWFNQITKGRYTPLLSSLARGDVETFVNELNDFFLETVSFRDFTKEAHYHTFILGLICSLCDTHFLDSNKEYGLGYPDFVLIPKSKESKLAVVIEFKHVKLTEKKKGRVITNKELTMQKRNEKLNTDASEGLNQINTRLYLAGFKRYPHIQEVIKVGLSFLGKSCAAYYQSVNLVTNESSKVLHILPDIAGIETEFVETDEDVKKKLSEEETSQSEEESEETKAQVSKKQKVTTTTLRGRGKSSASTQFGHDYGTGTSSSKATKKPLDDDESKNEAETRPKKQPKK